MIKIAKNSLSLGALTAAVACGGDDGLPVKAWMLQSRVRELLGGATQQVVLVVVDRRVPSERLIEAVDQCRLAGATDVAGATEQEAG